VAAVAKSLFWKTVHVLLVEYALELGCFKRYIARNHKVLNGYSYQVFSQIAAQSDPI